MAGMREIAKRAGTSLSTVSVVLNNRTDKYVSDAVKKRVLAAAADLHYTFPAQNRTERMKSIVVVLPAITSPFFSNVLSGVEGYVYREKKMMLYYNTNYDFERERDCLNLLKHQGVEGIILDSVCQEDQEFSYYKWLKKKFLDRGIPVVMLEKEVRSEDFYSVYVNNYEAEKKAVAHLISQGHREIAYIAGNPKVLWTSQRLEGYKDALKEAGISYKDYLVRYGDFSPVSGYLAMKELLNFGENFTALASANDQMAIGAVKAARQAGKFVPEDIAFIGFDNLSISTLIDPALSTVHVPTYQMGRMAAEIIGHIAEGEECQSRNLLETELIIRKSSDISAPNEWEMTGW